MPSPDEGEAANASRRPRPTKFGIWLPGLPPALSHAPYRRYWAGAVASVSGYSLVYFSQIWLIHELTTTPLYLGLVAAANAVPMFLLTLIGGVYADRLDRRTIIFGSQLILATLAAIMAAINFFDVVEPWHIVAIAAGVGVVSAFDFPARQAFYPSLVPRRDLTSAVAMNALVWQGVRVAAPAAVGFLVASIATSAVFVVGAIGFAVMAILLLAVRPFVRTGLEPEDRPESDEAERKNAAEALTEGLSFVRKKPEFRFLIGMVMFSSFFGSGYLVLMPVFADDILGVGALGMGWMLAAFGLGSITVTLWMASRGRLKGSGMLVVGGAALSGVSVAGFALTTRYVGSYPLAIGLMFTTGLFTSTYMVSIMSALQAMVPDRLRGRVMALYGISWSVMLLGGLQAGLIAHFIGVPAAVAIGGVAVTAFALGPALANPTIRRLKADPAQSFTIGPEAAEAPGP
jgi:MFS family permease